jgi:glycosyltransferase involved in cell wall biosynthesis
VTPLRVLQVDSARTWRGGQNQVLLTTRGLQARGHEVTLACANGGVLAERAAAAGLETHPLRFHGDASPFAVMGLLALMQRQRPQIVHAHDPHALSAALAASWLWQRPPVVASRRVDFRLKGVVSRAKYGRARRVIAVSRAIAGVLADDGLDTARVRVVHEGVVDRPPLPGGREALAGLGIPAGAPVIGNIAALVDHKDQATLVAAMALVARDRPDARLVIVGDGEKRAALTAQVQALDLAGQCVMAGFRTDLDALLPAFDVFCLSSRMEGLGTSVLDAMCFSRPIVVTAAGGLPESVEEGVSGRVVPIQDPRALADALLDVLRDPARARAMGAAARARFLQEFTADRMIDATLQVYTEVMG